jgi:hypothetical protein
LADQKVPVSVPRVRDLQADVEVPLTTYAQLQAPRAQDAGLFARVLGGLSSREYHAVAEAIPEAFGLAKSSASRCFVHVVIDRVKFPTLLRELGDDSRTWGVGRQDDESPAASFGQPWPGVASMVTETVVEQVVQALARGKGVSAIARAYGPARPSGRGAGVALTSSGRPDRWCRSWTRIGRGPRSVHRR